MLILALITMATNKASAQWHQFKFELLLTV